MIYKNLSLSIQWLTKSIEYKDIFSGLTCAISWKHVVWIVGENGVWKSTLAKILAWKMQPTKWKHITNGHIWYMPQEFSFANSVTIRSYLKNFVESREDYKIEKVLQEVGLDIDFSKKSDYKKLISELSGGQQRKIAFAKLLLQEKNIIILDEPTNHIDKNTKQRLGNWAIDFQWMLLVISHDRTFLNDMCDWIIEMQYDSLLYFDGNYEAYKRQKILLVQSQYDQYIVYEKRKKKMEAWLHTIRQRASVYISPALWRLLRNKEKYFDREILQKSVEKPKQEHVINTSFSWWTHAKKMILKIINGQLKRENNFLLNCVNIELRGTKRVLLEWANGVWKSTLLKAIFASYSHNNKQDIHIDWLVLWNDIKICYVDQHHRDLSWEKTVLEMFMYGAHGAYAQAQFAKSVLVQFGIWPEHWNSRICDMSYGQRVRIKFAQISTYSYDLLILDEPTNHLDIPTREAIEQALLDYEGALLIVSHDEYFVEHMMIDEIWEIRNNTIIID